MTHSSRQVKELPNVRVKVGANEFDCSAKSVSVKADFHNWGSNPRVTAHTSENIPGGLVQLDIKTRFGARFLAFTGKLADYHIAAE